MKESRVACNKQCATATRSIACGEETKRVVWHCRHCRHPHTVSAQWATKRSQPTKCWFGIIYVCNNMLYNMLDILDLQDRTPTQIFILF